jgi:multidrug resistance protein
LFLVFFSIGCDTYIVSPLIPIITSDLNINTSYGGYLVTAYSLLYVIFSLILGPISDKLGRKKMIIIGMFLFCISSFYTGLSGNYVMILIARGFTGIGAACAAPNVWSYIGDYFEYKERGRITGIIASGLSLGMILGVPIGSFLTKLISWRQNFYILGIISLIVVLLMIKLLPNIKIVKESTIKNNYKNHLKKIFQENIVVFSFIVTFLISFANFGLYTFLGYWLNKQFHLGILYVGLFLIIAGLGNFFGAQTSGFLSDKYGKKNIACISALIMAIVIILVPVFKFNIYLTIIVVFLWLGSGGASFTVMQVIATQLSSESRGTVMSINNSFFWGGTAIGSACISFIIYNSSFSIAALICSIASLSASVILYLFINDYSKI